VCLAKSVREGELINKIDKALGRRFRVSGEVRLGIGDDATPPIPWDGNAWLGL